MHAIIRQRAAIRMTNHRDPSRDRPLEPSPQAASWCGGPLRERARTHRKAPGRNDPSTAPAALTSAMLPLRPSPSCWPAHAPSPAQMIAEAMIHGTSCCRYTHPSWHLLPLLHAEARILTR